jgi:glycosyltransferase A (GT-A) superfamily protein (DUF2064 family)
MERKVLTEELDVPNRHGTPPRKTLDGACHPEIQTLEPRPMVMETARSSGERRALLVFADAAPLDLCRRRWPKTFQQLLKALPSDADGPAGSDVHRFSSHRFSSHVKCRTRFHLQRGSSFGERLENAVEDLAKLGYDQIVIVGQDCPDLETSDVARAFRLLESCRLVLGPDHRGGCYLIAFHVGERPLLKGVRWQRASDCQELGERFGAEDTVLLPVKQDLDTLEDLRLLARSESRFRGVAEFLLRRLAAEFEIIDFVRVDYWLRTMQLCWQLPPPALFPAA